MSLTHPTDQTDPTAPTDTTIRAAERLPLAHLVTLVDATATPPDAGDGALLRVSGHPPQVGLLGLGGDHPLEMLLGFTAPAQWQAVGIHCRARAYDVGPPDDTTGPHATTAAGNDSQPVVVTVLVDRSGHARGLLRRGPLATRLAGVPEGAVGDACCRALGLPTPAPPPSTVELWLRIWLDRVVEVAAFAGETDRLPSWEAVAALHPAAPVRPGGVTPRPDLDVGDVGLADPEALAETTHMLARAWPWDRLRRDPDVVDTARPPLPRTVTSWMDDGMFARWVLADVPGLGALSRSATALLPPPVVSAIGHTIAAAGLAGWAHPN
jgi:hypothetical protein